MLEEKERQNQLKVLLEQKDELNKKRERVLSACGLRPPPNLCTRFFNKDEAPKIAVHAKNEVVPKI